MRNFSCELSGRSPVSCGVVELLANPKPTNMVSIYDDNGKLRNVLTRQLLQDIETLQRCTEGGEG